MSKLLRIIIPHNPTHSYGLFGFIIMCTGLLLSGPGIYYQLQQNNFSQKPITLPSITTPHATTKKVLTGEPTRIQIPSLGIDLAVGKGQYNQTKASWTLSNDKAYYATVSNAPNDTYGNTFIYGHNRKSVFSKLSQLQKGAEVIIITDNNLQFLYRFSYTEATKPNDTSVMLPYSEKPTLSVQTCSGSWYQNRQIYRFDFVRVQKT